jgi:hypothetical protein
MSSSVLAIDHRATARASPTKARGIQVSSRAPHQPVSASAVTATTATATTTAMAPAPPAARGVGIDGSARPSRQSPIIFSSITGARMLSAGKGERPACNTVVDSGGPRQPLNAAQKPALAYKVHADPQKPTWNRCVPLAEKPGTRLIGSAALLTKRVGESIRLW